MGRGAPPPIPPRPVLQGGRRRSRLPRLLAIVAILAAPLGVMRFDDSLFRVLGDNLEALTSTPELILDPHTYEARSTESARLPGALVRDFALTL